MRPGDSWLPRGELWRYGRRPVTAWGVECYLCGRVSTDFDRKQQAADWLLSHRASFHSLPVSVASPERSEAPDAAAITW